MRWVCRLELKERGTTRKASFEYARYGTYDVPSGTWSDDTSMMLATN